MQDFPKEELIESLCEGAKLHLRDLYPDHERLWSACNFYPRVEYNFDANNDRLLVKYSMMFRRKGGVIHKTTTVNRIYINALETIPLSGIQIIFEGWTRDFIEKVNRAKIIRDQPASS
jgi:hypothetical protein